MSFGSGFGGFANGLVGGLQLGMAMKEMKSGLPTDKPDMGANASGSTAAGYSGDLSSFTPGDDASAKAAAPQEEESSGSWGFLKSLAGGAALGGIAGGEKGALLGALGGAALSGGLGETIMGKLGAGKTLAGGLLGGLFK